MLKESEIKRKETRIKRLKVKEVKKEKERKKFESGKKFIKILRKKKKERNMLSRERNDELNNLGSMCMPSNCCIQKWDINHHIAL